MDTKVHLLRTQEKGKFSVDNLLGNNEMIRIVLPHRVGLTLSRFGSVIALDCDLGWMPTDDIRVCEIDISKENYSSAMMMNPEFMSVARSFENSFHVDNFVNVYNKYYDREFFKISTKLFGDEKLDQVYIHLADNFHGGPRINIEFSVLKSKYMEDFEGRPELLDEPAMTLVGSIKLRGQHAHYFLFVEWWGDNKWMYSKNFFFNNTKFPEKNEVSKVAV